jgi:hypothetical protein
MKMRVKNWESFQHYKDRSPPWIKFHKSLLDDFDYQRLQLASKALAPMLWLIASEQMDGTFNGEPERLAFRLRWPVSDVVAGLKPLIDAGFVAFDSADSSGLLAECYQSAIPETETETETETDIATTSLVDSKLPTCPQQAILDLYAELLPTLPQPRIWDGARAKNLTARWRWVLADLAKHGKPHSPEDALGFFRRMFAYVEKSDLLMGRSGSWNASLDWIVKAENFAKIIQGNYENKE